MKTLIPFILLAFSLELKSQNSGSFYEYWLNINNISTTLDPTGSVGYGFSNPYYFFAPAESDVSPLYGTWLWITGVDQFNVVRDMCPLWYESENEIKTGPYTNKYDLFDEVIPAVVINNYNQVWKVTRAEIDAHKINFADAGYIIPDGILNWPANADTTYGSTQSLAPFTDFNSNNIYEPALGEYPNIKGDVALFAIYNDHKVETTLTTNPHMDLEVHVMLYAFYDAPGSALNNTVFVNYKVINRGTFNYHDLFAGIFSDFLLGAYDDNFVGADSTHDMMYVYNGDFIDGPTFPNYGSHLPAFGCISLNYPLHAFMYRRNGFTVLGIPVTAIQRHLCMDAKWLDGTPMTYGGDGYDSSPGATPTNFMYGGDPGDMDEWTEISESNPPGSRTGNSSIGPFNLNAGDELCFEFAYVFAQEENPETIYSPVYLLKNYVSQIKALNQSTGNDACIENKSEAQPAEDFSTGPFLIYPNPSGGMIEIQSGLPEGSVFFANVFDALGQRVRNYSFVNAYNSQTHIIDLSILASGTYLIRFEIEGHEFTEKVIVK